MAGANRGGMMRVAIVHNIDPSDMGQVGIALAEAGAEVVEHHPHRGGPLPALDGFDGLVVLGGEQSALDDDRYPYLPALAALMAAAAAKGRAVLGICLGSQVLARGLGGENRLGTAPEFGWTEIGLTEAGRADPVLSAAGPEFRSFEWHSDTFTLPPGAAQLASNPAVPMQAYRWGRAAYGMQFHFEANRRVVGDWTAGFPEAIARLQPDWPRRHTQDEAAHGAAADAAGLAIARAWVRRV